jgi:hypothetical protein
MNRQAVAEYLTDLRDRGDKPHIWMERGQWKVNDMPHYRGIKERVPLMVLWNKARKAVMMANLLIAAEAGITHIHWEVHPGKGI